MVDLEKVTQAASEAQDALAGLGIKGTTVKAEVRVEARVQFRFPDTKTYFHNSALVHNKELELIEKYPDVTFDFDVIFTNK